MSSYTTNTSDKSKKQALKLLWMGGLGFHLFYVGRIKAGIVRFFFGFIFWIMAIMGVVNPEEFAGGDMPPAAAAISMVIGALICLFIFNLPDLIKLHLGTFKDNVGNPLRE